jgi:hypothetical protein
MNCKETLQILNIVTVILVLMLNPLLAENIDPYDTDSQYAYGENVGWVNFEPNLADPDAGATVTSVKLSGFIWGENIGWINLDPNDADPNTGISNDAVGKLSGLAWGENVGWINFDPNVPADANDYGVTIDIDGNFDGWAWGENIGWVHFQSVSPVAYKVQVCRPNWDDLANFVDDWLQSGGGLPGDLSGNNDVDLEDYGIFAVYWLDYCPDDWPLK